MFALTGTADPSTSVIISSKMAMKKLIIIKMSPNRTNLRFSVQRNSKENVMEDLSWLIQKVEKAGKKTEKAIVFCPMMTEIASVVNCLMMKLGDSAYSPKGSHNPNDNA